MNFSMNGSPKELTAFLVALACNYAAVRGIQPPVVVEVPGPVNPPPDPGTSYDDPVKPETAKAEPDHSKGPSIASAPDVSPEVEKERSLGIPRPEEQKADEPKTRKSRAKKAADEVKPETGKQDDGAVKDESTKPEVEKPLTDNPTLPDGWDTWSVTKRRLWVETAPHLSPDARAKLLGDNPVPETQKTEQKQDTTKAEPTDSNAICALPPTWEAWSLAKRIMWAGMRSVEETNALLKQFGFADKIGAATAETLFQVRRKLEIAMRMEAQA